jgi:hypothetical protein
MARVLGLLLGLALVPLPALAELSEADLLSSGDRLLTRDSDSGLEWLDVRATVRRWTAGFRGTWKNDGSDDSHRHEQ